MIFSSQWAEYFQKGNIVLFFSLSRFSVLIAGVFLSADQLTSRGLPSSTMRECSCAARTGYTLVNFWSPGCATEPQQNPQCGYLYLPTSRCRVQQLCLYLLCLLLALSKLPLRDRYYGQKGKQRTRRLLLQSKRSEIRTLKTKMTYINHYIK